MIVSILIMAAFVIIGMLMLKGELVSRQIYRELDETRQAHGRKTPSGTKLWSLEHECLPERTVEEWGHSIRCNDCYPPIDVSPWTLNEKRALARAIEIRRRHYDHAATPLEKRIEARRGPQLSVDEARARGYAKGQSPDIDFFLRQTEALTAYDKNLIYELKKRDGRYNGM